MADYAIEGVVETVRSATESLVQEQKLALKTEVAKSLPIGHGDEQRLTQAPQPCRQCHQVHGRRRGGYCGRNGKRPFLP
jgi:hypothetical protein